MDVSPFSGARRFLPHFPHTVYNNRDFRVTNSLIFPKYRYLLKGIYFCFFKKEC